LTPTVCMQCLDVVLRLALLDLELTSVLGFRAIRVCGSLMNKP